MTKARGLIRGASRRLVETGMSITHVVFGDSTRPNGPRSAELGLERKRTQILVAGLFLRICSYFVLGQWEATLGDARNKERKLLLGEADHRRLTAMAASYSPRDRAVP